MPIRRALSMQAAQLELPVVLPVVLPLKPPLAEVPPAPEAVTPALMECTLAELLTPNGPLLSLPLANGPDSPYPTFPTLPTEAPVTATDGLVATPTEEEVLVPTGLAELVDARPPVDVDALESSPPLHPTDRQGSVKSESCIQSFIESPFAVVTGPD